MEESILSVSTPSEQNSPKKKPVSPTVLAKKELSEKILAKKRELIKYRGEIQKSKWQQHRLAKKELEKEAQREIEREMLYNKSVEEAFRKKQIEEEKKKKIAEKELREQQIQEKRQFKRVAKQMESEVASDEFTRYKKDSRWNATNKQITTQQNKQIHHDRFVQKVNEEREIKQIIQKKEIQHTKIEYEKEALSKLQFELSQLERETGLVKEELTLSNKYI